MHYFAYYMLFLKYNNAIGRLDIVHLCVIEIQQNENQSVISKCNSFT